MSKKCYRFVVIENVISKALLLKEAKLYGSNRLYNTELRVKYPLQAIFKEDIDFNHFSIGYTVSCAKTSQIYKNVGYYAKGWMKHLHNTAL